MRLLLVGYGRMGRLVGELAADYGCEVLGIVDPVSAAHSGDVNDPRWRDHFRQLRFSWLTDRCRAFPHGQQQL